MNERKKERERERESERNIEQMIDDGNDYDCYSRSLGLS